MYKQSPWLPNFAISPFRNSDHSVFTDVSPFFRLFSHEKTEHSVFRIFERTTKRGENYNKIIHLSENCFVPHASFANVFGFANIFIFTQGKSHAIETHVPAQRPTSTINMRRTISCRSEILLIKPSLPQNYPNTHFVWHCIYIGHLLFVIMREDGVISRSCPGVATRSIYRPFYTQEIWPLMAKIKV